LRYRASLWLALNGTVFLTLNTKSANIDWLFLRAAFEIVALAAGRLGELPLAAQSVIMTLDQSTLKKYVLQSVLTIVSMKF
jgi:hypothetical protein